MGQTQGRVVDLAAQQVEVLLQIAVEHRHLEFDGEHGHRVTALGLNLVYVGQGPQLLLHHLRHLELYFVGVGPGPRHYDHGLLGRDGGVLQFGHLDEG